MANLSRQIRKPRFVIGNGGKFGRLIPFSYHQVFAGESQHNIKTQLSFMSKPVAQRMSGATVDIWYYYVPWRLVWSDFPTWVMGDSALTPPNTNYDFGRALFGLQGFNAQGHMVGTAYEMIVNQYFREEHDHFVINNGAPVPAVLPIVDRTAETQGDEDYEEEDETIDVSGGTLSLKTLEQHRAKLAYERRVESLDGKYTSFLRAQGVNANETVAQIPEFLGHYRKYIKPQRTVNDSTGLTVQSFAHECTHTLSKRRFFQEHGVVIGCASIRPKVHLNGGSNADSYIWASPQQFPHVGQLAEHKKIANEGLSSRGGVENESDYTPDTYLNIDHYLWNGRTHVLNVDSSYINAYDPTDDETALYPSAAWDAVPSDNTAAVHFNLEGVMSSKIATPLRRLKVL
jgi:hypothetical protein